MVFQGDTRNQQQMYNEKNDEVILVIPKEVETTSYRSVAPNFSFTRDIINYFIMQKSQDCISCFVTK